MKTQPNQQNNKEIKFLKIKLQEKDCNVTELRREVSRQEQSTVSNVSHLVVSNSLQPHGL